MSGISFYIREKVKEQFLIRSSKKGVRNAGVVEASEAAFKGLCRFLRNACESVRKRSGLRQRSGFYSGRE